MIKEKNDQGEKKSTEKQFVKCDYILVAVVVFSGGAGREHVWVHPSVPRFL